MSRKTSPARRAAFIRAVRETGNQTIAAERAKVSRSWVQLQRSADPAFKAEVAAAVAEAKAFLSSAPDRVRSNQPARGWQSQDGEELVVRGSRGRRVQVARARLHQWTPRVEERFLAMLAQTCNLRRSLKEVGLSAASLHQHRKRWPDFDARCDAAILAGYQRIDQGMTAAAIALFDPPDFPIAQVVAPLSIDDAIRIARLHERRAREAARRALGREAGPRWPGR